MPEFKTFDEYKTKVCLYADDHNPPHFHVLTPDHEALVDIDTLVVFEGQIPTKVYRMVKAWAETPENKAALNAEWSRLNERD